MRNEDVNFEAGMLKKKKVLFVNEIYILSYHQLLISCEMSSIQIICISLR